MSMMGELTFFLTLQIQQSEEGMFICQTKYTKKLIQKFGMSSSKAIGTPMSPSASLDKDEQGKPVDETKYRGMIGSLLYLTTSQPDIMFSVCDKEDGKSTSGTCQLLGKALISWNSKKQGSVALSTTEAEYIAIGQCFAQLLWMSHQLGISKQGFFIALKDKPIAHGRVVDLDDMEALNCKCKCSGFPMLFKNSLPDDFKITNQAKRCIAECSSEYLPNS
ncbi:PREDICTED: uncharacterized protein LOC109227819 [Nicotiana attenuata]|uniref:uncharacterized protein LOC109227819 n=1 Tax=Nicotiana attenuata TaxID=49451 RepID=UPI000904A586|nr:PREDICTED: uncharacterized protein LOC109227819 [Nicotiana attenuata]